MNRTELEIELKQKSNRIECNRIELEIGLKQKQNGMELNGRGGRTLPLTGQWLDVPIRHAPNPTLRGYGGGGWTGIGLKQK